MAVSVSRIKRTLIGEPFPTHREAHERLDKARALAVFASDPISSNAYATEAIMSVLILMGVGALRLTMPLALGVMGLVLLVVFSYIQTILHYPDGGGAYTVTKDNLGEIPSLFAGSALLIDYILTVSVSVSAGIRAITSAAPELLPYSVPIALFAIVVLTWVNLRGVRESGTIFAIPTYLFVAGVLITVVIGVVRISGVFGLPAPVIPVHEVETAVHPITTFLFIWLLMRAFAAGCTALTGIEAISNGVQAFQKPEARNAALTMVTMGIIAMSLFIGITFVSTQLHLIPYEQESILSQMTRAITTGIPGGRILYYWVQIFTMLILILAANTGYQDFPRLSSFLAKDGYLPRWMQNRGDRLVFNSGIITLAVIASIVVVAFHADEIAMLPLYALGVMLSFTLSQSGMFRLMGRIAHLKPGEILKTQVTTVHYEKGVWWKRALNGIGALVTFIVLLVLIATKFVEGAWIIVLAIPVLVYVFRAIKRHYNAVAAHLSTETFSTHEIRDIADAVIIPVAGVHRGTLRALRYASMWSDNVCAISISTDETFKERLLAKWAEFPEITDKIHLEIVDYEYRDILTPMEDYIVKAANEEYAGKLVTVVIPEFIPERTSAKFLHNQTANLLRRRLRQYDSVVIIDVPYLVQG
jgi:amino acid transporter